MSILSELKKLTGKKANVISEALPDKTGGGGLAVHASVVEEVSPTTWTLDHTWQEIHDAMLLGPCVVVYALDDPGDVRVDLIINANISNKMIGSTTYNIDTHVLYSRDNIVFTADAPTDFPSYTLEVEDAGGGGKY